MTPAPDHHPPATKFTAYVIDKKGPLTTGELLEETELARTTLQDSLERLRTEGVVRTVPNPDDPRTPLHRLNDG